MGEIFLPEEFMIIGTALKLRKNIVSLEEINEYMKRNTFPIEYSDEKYRFCTYDENKKSYSVVFPDKIHPYILNILTNI